MKSLQYFLLRIGFNVDEYILATDKIHAAERWIIQQIMRGKYANIPNGFYDLVVAVYLSQNSAPCPPGIHWPIRFCDRLPPRALSIADIIQIGSKYLYRRGKRLIFRKSKQANGQRISFFAIGTGRRPYSYGIVIFLSLEYLPGKFFL